MSIPKNELSAMRKPYIGDLPYADLPRKVGGNFFVSFGTDYDNKRRRKDERQRGAFSLVGNKAVFQRGRFVRNKVQVNRASRSG